MCGKPAVEHYQSDSRQTWYSCDCDLRRRLNEAKNTLNILGRVAEKREHKMRLIKGYYREIKGLEKMKQAIEELEYDEALTKYKSKFSE